MKKPDLPENEEARLRALKAYKVLDTPFEEAFDALTRVAAHIAQTPIALVSLIDTDRQWFKSRYGLDAPETPRDVSFCGHVVADDHKLIVNDAFDDERFADNPLVTGQPRVRFYAGHPLRNDAGLVMGTLCVIDHERRELSAEQLTMLELLSKQVVDQLEIRRTNIELQSFRQFFHLSLNLLCTANDQLYFEHLNPAWTDVLGWTLDELRSKPFTEFVHPDDLESTFAEAGALFEGATTVNYRNRYVHKEGHYVPLSWMAAFDDGTFYASATDMAEYDANAEKMAGLASVVETSYDAIITSTSDRKIKTWNRAAGRMFGYTADEVIGQSVQILQPPDCIEEGKKIFRELRDGKTVEPFDTMRRRKDGTDFEVSIALSPLRTAHGEFSGLSSIVRDITEQKKLDRMKSEFVSTVSHELRTPLTSIRGSLGLVAGGVLGELPAEAKEYVDIAVTNSERLVRLINDILDMEKMESGRIDFRFSAAEIGPLVQDAVVSNASFAMAEKVEFKIVTEMPRGEVVVDSDRLAQVLTNFLSNAAKFSADGSTVEVAVSADNHHVIVSVRDYGPGISPEFRDRIFERFSQADSSTTRKKGGTGLGLAISKAIIEKMHGTIGFENAVGEGAVFWFKLPFLPPVEDVRDTNRVTSILVCEDDPDAARVLEKTLVTRGYRVDISPTIERARRLLTRNRYAAMTLDIVLADGLGTELLREVRANPETKSLPIIVVSGSLDRFDSGLAFLASDVLQKPIDESLLLGALNNAVAMVANTQPRLLHVEDEEDLRRVIARILSDEWDIVSVNTVAAGRKALAEQSFDVVLLDLGLPDGTGEELIEHVGDAQVIIFSASDAPAQLHEKVSASLVKSRSDLVDLREVVSALIERSTQE